MKQISLKSWRAYVTKLKEVSTKASTLMGEFITLHGVNDTKLLMDYAFLLATRYGAAAAALAAEMYDATALLQGVSVPAAIPAETATYSECAKMVNGTRDSILRMQNGAGRLVKQAAADTTTQNAIRDGAEWAWIPSGDTCAFCLVLSGNGWKRASKKMLRGGHAEHIHSNCDCQFAVRFGPLEIEGYDPEALADKYYDAPGNSNTAKINYLRRQNRAKDRDAINARKRELYAQNKAQNDK